jgi:hypothetical protein
MKLKDVPADDFIWAWNEGGGVTARAAEFLEAMGYARHRLRNVERRAESLRSRGVLLLPRRRRGRFIPFDKHLAMVRFGLTRQRLLRELCRRLRSEKEKSPEPGRQE